MCGSLEGSVGMNLHANAHVLSVIAATSQLASETTTVDIMRKGSSTYDSNSDTIDYPGAYKGLTRSATNLIAFFRAGDYIVKTEKLSTGYLLGRSDSATHQGCSGCYQWLVFGASKLQKHRN